MGPSETVFKIQLCDAAGVNADFRSAVRSLQFQLSDAGFNISVSALVKRLICGFTLGLMIPSRLGSNRVCFTLEKCQIVDISLPKDKKRPPKHITKMSKNVPNIYLKVCPWQVLKGRLEVKQFSQPTEEYIIHLQTFTPP